MNRRLLLGPFNRVEGDLEVHLEVANEVVTSARVSAPMFRGFESLMLSRAPEDALVIAPRICGICSVSQSTAVASALANLQGAIAPPNGILARLLAHACENMADHLTHFYLFFLPDFVRDLYRKESWFAKAEERFSSSGTSRSAALAARAGFLHVTGILCGKWPHTLAIQPGGTTSPVDAGAKIRLRGAISAFRRFLETRVYGGSLEEFAQIACADELWAWMEGKRDVPADLPLFLQMAASSRLSELGRGHTALISYGAYDREGDALFARGLWNGSEVQELALGAIREDVVHASYETAPPSAPDMGQTLPAPEKADAYSWCKAPRLNGAPMETGAFARQVIAGNALAGDLVRAQGANAFTRVLGRWIEMARVIPQMEKWASELCPGEPFLTPMGAIPDGDAVGLVEAARGALGHWMSVKEGRISQYQIIAPTTWNFSPRDGEGVPGPLEQALVGAPVGRGEDTPVTVQHVVRSFDPCMVCTVH